MLTFEKKEFHECLSHCAGEPDYPACSVIRRN